MTRRPGRCWGRGGSTGANTVQVVVRNQQVLADPTTVDIACALGLNIAVRQETPADLLVVGTGPAGLAAAVYGAPASCWRLSSTTTRRCGHGVW